MKARIALIIPYFGALPRWFPYFAKSIAHTPILDVLLFTDARVDQILPENIKVHCCSLAEFAGMASDALSFSVSPATPFKVCDLRPAFGEICQEYIRDYEFWAFGDLDLIYGELEAFLLPLLSDYDVISFRKGWISGSLCVLKNCKEINSLYTHSVDWQRVFLSPDNLLFDEMGGPLYSKVLGGADVLSLQGAVDSFTHVVKRLARERNLRCSFSELACEEIDWGETLLYDSGKITRSRDGHAVMYVHYVCMKRRFFDVPRVTEVPDKFYIRKTGIYLEHPNLRTIISQETGRVIRGGIQCARRLLQRYIGFIGLPVQFLRELLLVRN